MKSETITTIARVMLFASLPAIMFHCTHGFDLNELFTDHTFCRVGMSIWCGVLGGFAWKND